MAHGPNNRFMHWIATSLEAILRNGVYVGSYIILTFGDYFLGANWYNGAFHEMSPKAAFIGGWALSIATSGVQTLFFHSIRSGGKDWNPQLKRFAFLGIGIIMVGDTIADIGGVGQLMYPMRYDAIFPDHPGPGYFVIVLVAGAVCILAEPILALESAKAQKPSKRGFMHIIGRDGDGADAAA